MRSYRPLISIAYACLAAVSRAVFYLAETIGQLVVYAVNAIAPAEAFDWMMTRYAKPAAYRVISLLKPEYRESFATHGLSLKDLRGFC